MYFCISVFASLAHAASNWKALNHEINYKKKLNPRNTHETKFWTQEIPTRKMLNPQSTHEKNFRSHEYPRRNFGRTKYSQKKKFRPKNTHEKNFWTHELLTIKNLGLSNTHEKKSLKPLKYPGKTNLHPQNARRHSGTKPTKPTIARDPRNIAQTNSVLI